MVIKTILVENENNQRIDKYLNQELDDVTRSQIQMMIADNDILVNDEQIKASYLIKEGDVIEVTFKDPIIDDVVAENIPIDIYYEDQDIIVVNKASGMVVHPAIGNLNKTLVNALMYHCKDLSGINGIKRAGIVHRIDKDTSGLLVACKNDMAHRDLSKQFIHKDVSRKYYAIVHGVINHNYGKIDAPISRSFSDRKQMAVVEGGKNAVTHFRVLERFRDFTLVELTLETGRTHQIRVHMKYIGHPVAGDPTYGPRKVLGEHGQFLHAKTLGFIHPRTKEYMEWESPLPDYFEEFLKEIKKDN